MHKTFDCGDVHLELGFTLIHKIRPLAHIALPKYNTGNTAKMD